MHIVETLASIWFAATAAFVAVLIYRSYLLRRESSELFLSDEAPLHHVESQTVAARINRLRPAVQTATGAFALVSLLLVGTYVAQLLPSVRL